MRLLPEGISLGAGEVSDVAAIHELTRLAFATDAHTQLKELVRGRAVFEETSHSAWLAGLVGRPGFDVVVARDGSAPGEVAGYIVWGSRDAVLEEGAEAPAKPVAPPLPPHRPLRVSDLEAMTDRSMREWQAHLCGAAAAGRCRFVVSLAVHPRYQGRGVGGALLRWGTARCDDEESRCWAQASMGSRAAYEGAGFREVGRLQLDLDLFCEGKAKQGGGSWGVYVWPYMQRDPVPRAEAGERTGRMGGS